MRLNKQNTVIVESLVDIKSVIQEFLPDHRSQSVEVHAELADGGKKYMVTAPADCDYKKLLSEGFEIIRKRVEAAGRAHASGQASPINITGRMWLDDLIERRLGGKRDGLRVKWVIKDTTYYFDPFTGKLTCS